MLESVKTEADDKVNADTDDKVHPNINNDNGPASPPLTHTNFTINEILRPDFGLKKPSFNCNCAFSAFTPVKSQRYREGCSPPVSPSSTYSDSVRTPPPVRVPPPLPDSTALNLVVSKTDPQEKKQLWPAWVYCTRYSDRPSSGKSIFPSFTIQFVCVTTYSHIHLAIVLFKDLLKLINFKPIQIFLRA